MFEIFDEFGKEIILVGFLLLLVVVIIVIFFAYIIAYQMASSACGNFCEAKRYPYSVVDLLEADCRCGRMNVKGMEWISVWELMK